jgi:N-glycosylase/DNA lyase
MNDLLSIINDLKHSTTHKKIHQRIQQLKTLDTHSAMELFSELSFCILTANFNAERTITIHKKLQTCFCTETKESLAKKLRTQGYRFPNTRAAYIVKSATKKDILPYIIHTLPHEERREWLVQNIPGIGYKEASHFLRNIGFDNYAIIDVHILDILERYHLIKKPKTLTRKKYKEIEQILRSFATQAHLTLAELDFYLWFLETGKILK